MNTPPVTVLMPAYNAGKYIGEAIESVLSQTFTDFELVIVNDGSTDRTADIIHRFTDNRIRLINQQNMGVSAALNNGLKESRGIYIARFDADDICYPERIEKQYRFMQSNPEYVLVGSDASYIDMTGEFVFSLKYPAYSDAAIRALDPLICPFSHVTVMYKRETVLVGGGYNEHAHTFEDHLLWAKLIRMGSVCNLHDTLVKVRFNPESVTIDEKWRSKQFRKIKYDAILKGDIDKMQGDILVNIIRQQNTDTIKKGAYYSLLAKKYLLDNYHPEKARENARKLVKLSPLKMGGYFLLLLSFLPKIVLGILYKMKTK